MKRAWIIGNGPSLKNTPLDLLKNEFTIASNRVHLIFKDTSWRPSAYVRSEEPDGYDADIVYADIGEMFKLGIPVWMPRHFNDGVLHGVRKHQKPTSVEEYFNQCQHTEPPTEWHLPSICTYGTVTSAAMQIAVKMGYEELCLVGVDWNYEEGKNNHFSAEYETKGYIAPADAVLKRHYQAYENAKRSCPVPIINCTVGGKLELFPRMTIEEVLSGKRLQPGQGEPPGSQVHGDQGSDGPKLQGSADSEGQPEIRKEGRVHGGRSRSGK